MPKLVLDERAILLAVERLGGQSIFAGPDGGLLDPGVVDVLEDWSVNAERWQPGNEATERLVLGAEACREISDIASRWRRGSAERRVLKQLTVPICLLIEQVDRLASLLNTDQARAERSHWPAADQGLFIDHGRALRKKHKDGPVRQIRNKLGAHLDAGAIGTIQASLRPEDVLPVMDEVVVLFFLALKHESPFSWLRPVADPRGNAVETFFRYPVCVRWITDDDGEVLDVGNVQIAADPRGPLQKDALAAARAYNELVAKTGVNLRRIVFRPTADLLAEERQTSSS
ncbi:MAG TPA: hypothetical protein PKA64_07270 [Myxococcota bacterium]|nr:hypothetical protein [Myxococcota bacterium]